MKILICFIFHFYALLSFADETIFPNDAETYLKKLNCEFSAFAIYTGPTGSVEMLGSLKSGQAYSRAICIASYSEGGAKKHNFCILRVVDMKSGNFVGTATYGSRWRDERGQCSKDSIIKVLDKNKSEFSGHNKEWKIVSDRFSAVPTFKNVIDGSLINEQRKLLKYGKYLWLFWHHTDTCSDMPESAENNINDQKDPSKILEQNESKLILQVRKEQWTYFTSKELCEAYSKSKK